MSCRRKRISSEYEPLMIPRKMFVYDDSIQCECMICIFNQDLFHVQYPTCLCEVHVDEQNSE
jgi:hypothetical protein